MNPAATSLDRLHDIVLPSPVPWWPPAPGWYWVSGFVFVLVLVRLTKWFVHRQHDRYRREALAELARHEMELKNPARRAEALVALAELLKRTALTAFPREEVAALTGPEWFQFLDRTGRAPIFCAGHGEVLERAVYDPRTVDKLDDAKLERLTSVVRDWLTHHRVATGGSG